MWVSVQTRDGNPAALTTIDPSSKSGDADFTAPKTGDATAAGPSTDIQFGTGWRPWRPPAPRTAQGRRSSSVEVSGTVTGPPGMPWLTGDSRRVNGDTGARAGAGHAASLGLGRSRGAGNASLARSATLSGQHSAGVGSQNEQRHSSVPKTGGTYSRITGPPAQGRATAPAASCGRLLTEGPTAAGWSPRPGRARERRATRGTAGPARRGLIVQPPAAIRSPRPPHERQAGSGPGARGKPAPQKLKVHVVVGQGSRPASARRGRVLVRPGPVGAAARAR